MSGSTFPQRLTRIDDLTRSDHSYLTAADSCYYVGEYTARAGYAYSVTNSLIHNFKKAMDRRGLPEWPHKEAAIQMAAKAFRHAIASETLDGLTFVPIPPSMSREDRLYDDRLTRMLNAIRPNKRLDIRELIVQTESTSPVHSREVRPTPEQIENRYKIDLRLATPTPSRIVIVDDILTSGAHFRAAKSIRSAQFPSVDKVGLFIARRVPQSSDVEDFFT